MYKAHVDISREVWNTVVPYVTLLSGAMKWGNKSYVSADTTRRNTDSKYLTTYHREANSIHYRSNIGASEMHAALNF
jgi:hypothetical protein